MHIHDLPFEVITKVFFYLAPFHLPLEYALVCKSWTVPALQMFYKKLDLNDLRCSHVNRYLKLNKTERKKYFKYGNFVQEFKLLCNDYPPEEFKEEDFITLLEYFPNIKTLDMCSDENSTKYFQYLLRTKSSKCLNQIQKLKFPQNVSPEILQMYPALRYKYRATIGSMSIEYQDMSCIGAEKFDKTLDYLKQFPSLKNLTITGNYNSKVTIFEIQKSCPNLTSLNYGLTLRDTEEEIGALLNDPANRNALSNLKELVLNGSISAGYLKYLTECDLTQLSKLEIPFGHDLYDWVNDVKLENLLKFFNRLSTLDTTVMFFLPKVDEPRNTRSDETKMTIFFKLVNAFKGKKNLFCQMDIGDNSLYDEEECLLFDSMHCDPVNGLSFSYVLENTEYQEGDRKRPNINFKLPDIDNTETGLEMVNYLRASIRFDKSPSLESEFIKYVLTNHPNLELFDFEYNKKHRQHISIGRDASHSARTKKKYHSSSTNTKENLRAIETKNFTPSPKLLKMLSTHLPNIEFLSCIEPVETSKESQLIAFNLTTFKNLKTFYVDIDSLSYYMDFVFVCFSHGNKSAPIYYHQKSAKNVLLPCDKSFMEERYRSYKFKCSRINIRCTKGTRILFGHYETLIAEIENGVLLDDINQDSYFKKR
ncbi:uncharacterized protein EV154DRAFT_497131 [Mucor mucedo]|uniref:uncharacterized protein n=1 Tax=Mucor mucedo TaxID=29922 RepID=UPI00221F1CA7|nr:uncharacterized protein EV154DRAFT_497131 [Mucor mucedo]KAI7894820.1 hypothetical protein EV154DRAFT_497131 [Mucor mucedo]